MGSSGSYGEGWMHMTLFVQLSGRPPQITVGQYRLKDHTGRLHGTKNVFRNSQTSPPARCLSPTHLFETFHSA